MATTYGSFPGVKVTTAGGGITAVAVGGEETLVLFGQADYDRDGNNVQDDGLSADTADGLDSANTTATIEEPVQINGRTEADTVFGDGTELANAMKKALANGANIDFLHGVAVQRYIQQDVIGTQTGQLSNVPVVEDTSEIWFDDGGTPLDVRFVYADGTPPVPNDADTVNLNPLTGQYAADAAPGTDFTIDYRSLDYSMAFDASAVGNVINEDDTALFTPLSEADTVSSSLQGTVSSLRTNEYKLVNALHAAEPNDNEVSDVTATFTNDENDARYDAANYSSANQSVDADYFFKLAPVRQENVKETVMGGVGGLFAGNPINDPIYNDPLNGYSALEQSFSKSEANDMRDENVIPIRQAGSIRVKDNLSTSTETDWERDFWRRRITDRVILIAKTIGDAIIGNINDEDTRGRAQRNIEAEMRGLISDRLIQPNDDAEKWFVDVYESSTNSDEVKIDIGFTPYGIVKRIDTSVTINT